MKLFNQNRNPFYVVRLFKITDQRSAIAFPTNKLFLKTIEEIQSLTGLKASGFNLNYTKDFETINGFKSALTSLPEIVYGSVGFGDDDRRCFLSIDNAMINHTIKPENSSIDFFIQFAESYYKAEELARICKELITLFDFEYGYIQQFPGNFDGVSERKVKRGLFSKGVEVNEFDFLWTFHSVGLRYGYLKNLYTVNFLNKSHFENSDLLEIVEKFGVKEFLSSDMIMWTVTNEEIEVLKTMPVIKRRIIQIEKRKNEFLEKDDSKKFYALMKLEHMNANFS